MLHKMVRPDDKGRISLGHLADSVSRFSVVEDKKHHRIILEPYTEIPAREAWLFKNPKALKKVKQGLKESAENQVYDLGSFDEYLDEEEGE